MSGAVAVTGAGGFVGRAVVRELRAAGLPPRCVVRAGGSPPPAGFDDVRAADLSDVASLTTAFSGCAAVVHAAGCMSGTDDECFAVNLDGTRNVLRAIERAGVPRLAFVSTVAVYGDGDMVDIDEDRAVRPRGGYAESKARAEDAVRAACAATGLAAWSLRPITVYGGEDRQGFSAFLLQLARDGVIPLLRGGGVRFDLTAARDLARACVLATTTGDGGAGGPLHVTSGEGLTVRDIADRLRDELGLPARTIAVADAAAPPDGVPRELARAVAEDRSFSIARAANAIGYRPEVRFPGDLGSLLR